MTDEPFLLHNLKAIVKSRPILVNTNEYLIQIAGSQRAKRQNEKLQKEEGPWQQKGKRAEPQDSARPAGGLYGSQTDTF